jgi:hypothetical protein
MKVVEYQSHQVFAVALLCCNSSQLPWPLVSLGIQDKKTITAHPHCWVTSKPYGKSCCRHCEVHGSFVHGCRKETREDPLLCDLIPYAIE